jgi:hypothetical protein
MAKAYRKRPKGFKVAQARFGEVRSKRGFPDAFAFAVAFPDAFAFAVAFPDAFAFAVAFPDAFAFAVAWVEAATRTFRLMSPKQTPPTDVERPRYRSMLSLKAGVPDLIRQ